MSKLLQTFKNDPGFYGAHVCSDGEQQLAAIDGRLCGVAAVQIAACNSAINYLIGQLLDNSRQLTVETVHLNDSLFIISRLCCAETLTDFHAFPRCVIVVI